MLQGIAGSEHALSDPWPSGYRGKPFLIEKGDDSMVAIALYPWLRFGFGILTGCWIGVALGVGMAVILAGRRIKDLEEANALLRTKLRVRDKARQSGTGGSGPILIVPPNVHRPASAPLGRVASGR